MKHVLPRASLLALLLLPLASQAELLGYVGAQGRWFSQDALDQRQSDDAYSMVIEPEWFAEFNDRRDSLNVKLFYRHDDSDDERSHGDIRQACWQHVGDGYELTLGINKVFWGVTESQHLVDIVNQTDLVEAPDGEEKLGQPMVHLALLRDWGVLDVMLLPGFRERTFPGVEGRLRSQPVTIEEGRYDSGAEDSHTDVALRWSHYLGEWSLGATGFWGTSREPLFTVASRHGETVLQPYYPIIQQTGIDAQFISGDWLWKLEAIYRNYLSDSEPGSNDPEGQDFFASTAGFEKTLVGIVGTDWDLGVLAEYSYDSRDEMNGAVYQNELFAGGRLSFNDIASSEILAGVVQDLDDSDSRLGFVEASTRFGNATRVTLELYHFSAQDPEEALYFFRRDSFVELAVEYYF